jgi:long-chain acyl-CoA synthetase
MRFYEGLHRFAGNLAAIDVKGREYTYSELIEESDRFGQALASGRKNLVFVLCGNNFESMVGYFGTLRSGNAVILLAADTDTELMANLVKLYRPDYLWRPATASDLAERLQEKLAKHFPTAQAEGAGGAGQSAYWHGDYCLECHQVERQIAINPDLALLLSTSGSTGSPKAVRLTGDNVDANAASIAEYLKLDAAERPITALPMHYSFGLSIINSHLRVGATLLLTNDSIVTRSFWDFFNRHKATSFSGVPYTYEVLRRFKFFEMSLPSMKTMTQAGGKLTPKFAQEFAEFSHQKGIDFYIMYGQTEATARISYLPPRDNLTKYHSIGIAIPQWELRLIDEQGRPITTPGVDGELVYRGPNVMMGYAEGEADLAKGDELNGELKTGDVARFDDEGYFYITGRMKRFIKIFGNRVNLDEIEHHLKSLGYVSVCGGKDDLLCVATTDRGKAAEIKNTIVNKYGFHHTAVRAIEVDEILKSSSGKIQYERMFEGILK